MIPGNATARLLQVYGGRGDDCAPLFDLTCTRIVQPVRRAITAGGHVGSVMARSRNESEVSNHHGAGSVRGKVPIRR